MSFSSAISPFDPESENWWSKGASRLAKRITDVSLFVRAMQIQMRFGDLTRAPLKMLRFQIKGNIAECDWLARLPDPWDGGLRPDVGERHASLQALRDAVNVQSLLFFTLPDVDAAYLRIYREANTNARELIIAGNVHRGAASFRGVHSVAMRAKLLGFRFMLEDDVLQATREVSNLELVDW
jgi:hypothetical protein